MASLRSRSEMATEKDHNYSWLYLLASLLLLFISNSSFAFYHCFLRNIFVLVIVTFCHHILHIIILDYIEPIGRLSAMARIPSLTSSSWWSPSGSKPTAASTSTSSPTTPCNTCHVSQNSKFIHCQNRFLNDIIELHPVFLCVVLNIRFRWFPWSHANDQWSLIIEIDIIFLDIFWF